MVSTPLAPTAPLAPIAPLAPFARRHVAAAVVVACGLLAVTLNRYGYHRDELYFRMLDPAWGYVDQPPLTPLLAKGSVALFGDTVWGLRLPSVLAIALAIVLIALTTRELGGGTRAQALSAWGFAFAGLPLATGHLLTTATLDFALWAAVLLFATRALLREQPQWWLAAGAVVGVAMYNKLLIAMLLIGLGVGLAAVGPRRVLRSPWLWGGVGLALLIGAPNLIYQATHDFPQVSMAGALSENNGGEVRAKVLPFQVLLIGPLLFPVAVAGFLALLRRPQWRPVRAVAVAYLVVLGLNFAAGGQIYYAFGLAAYLLAAGWVPTVDWMAEVGRRRALVVGAVALNAVISALVALPLLPVTVVGDTPVVAINETQGEQIGWPTYVRSVADVYRALPPSQQFNTVIFTGNYGEAGAIDRYGPEYGLPPVYSGHNELFYLGPPLPEQTTVLVWSHGISRLGRIFEGCQVKAVLDNGVDVDNEEQGSTVAVCQVPAQGWAATWPALQHHS